MNQKTIVFSMDAMVGEDVLYMRSKPNFSRLFSQCAQVTRLQSIYPSITYPAHVSLMTGCKPGRHGIVTNGTFKTTGGGPDWHLCADAIQVEDIFAAAKASGCSTAAVYWPVTGNNKNIDFLINEYFFPDPQEDILEGFRKFGANEQTLDIIRENLHRFPTNFRNRPYRLQLEHTFDDFINGCTCSMIRKLKPDLLLVHNCLTDTFRHHYGLQNDLVRWSLDQLDLWLGELLQAMEDAGTLVQTNFILLSDHGQMDYARGIKLNLLLRRGGFVDVDNTGRVTGWRAFAQSNGMSASIFVDREEDLQPVYDYLLQLKQQQVWGIGQVYTARQLEERYGLYGDFAFFVETDGITTFDEGWEEPLVFGLLEDYRLGHATHGYEPWKGAQPVFVARGPAFLPGAVIEDASAIDAAPTAAAAMGLSMPQAQGRVLRELLKNV